MNVITTNRYVAGIFAAWTDVQHYLTLKPVHIHGFVHTSGLDLEYPFYLLELGDGGFVGYQTEAEARAQPIGDVLYTIVGDYQPEIPWEDVMGDLPHKHLRDLDDA